MIEKVKAHCLSILKTSECAKLPFHNVQHTLEVVENVRLIAHECDFTKSEIESIVIAAWFHDTGFAETYKGHENVSKRYAKEFLVNHSYHDEGIEIVLSCIDATKMPQQPSSRFAEVLCDADIFHISNPHFFYRKLLLRREWEVFCEKRVSDLAWHQLNLEFLRKHYFFTAYGKKTLTSGQDENTKKVLRLIEIYS